MCYLNDPKSDAINANIANDGSLLLTSGVIHVHEDHVLIGKEEGVKLLMVDSRKLSDVPVLSSVHRDMDHTLCALARKNTCDTLHSMRTGIFNTIECLERSKSH